VIDYDKYRVGFLNRQTILLLLTNGVKSDVFLKLQQEYIKELEEQVDPDDKIFDTLPCGYSLYSTKELIKDCHENKIEVQNEPFVKAVVETLKVRAFVNLKQKANILVRDSVRVFGVLDEYGILNHGEIYLCISPSNGKDSQDYKIIEIDKVIVTKNPCLYLGDIRVLKAVRNKQTEKHFKHLINCIVFSSKCPRPHTNEIAASDLDGDMYFIGWNPLLIPPKIARPMSYRALKTEDKSATNEDIINFFVEFSNNDQLGKIDNAHLSCCRSKNACQ